MTFFTEQRFSHFAPRCLFQARLPALIGEVKSEEKNDHLETLVWHPNCIMDCDLLMYLRAARFVSLSPQNENEECNTEYIEIFY